MTATLAAFDQPSLLYLTHARCRSRFGGHSLTTNTLTSQGDKSYDAIAMINAWNRLSIGMRAAHPSDMAKAA
jgi:hypothetical protein